MKCGSFGLLLIVLNEGTSNHLFLNDILTLFFAKFSFDWIPLSILLTYVLGSP